jgi:hypothetical protein
VANRVGVRPVMCAVSVIEPPSGTGPGPAVVVTVRVVSWTSDSSVAVDGVVVKGCVVCVVKTTRSLHE